MIADYYNHIGIKRINESLVDGCLSNNLSLVKYLLTSLGLNQNADIHYLSDKPLKVACQEGHLEIVKYLLTSSDLKEHANINASQDKPLQLACMHSHLDTVKYLLSSPELKRHAHIHTNQDYIFKATCAYGDFEIIQYLILDFNIRKTADIEDYLMVNKGMLATKIEKLFEMRKLNMNLKMKTNENIYNKKNIGKI